MTKTFITLAQVRLARAWRRAWAWTTVALCAGLVVGCSVANYPLPVRGDENIFAARPAAQAPFPGNYPSYGWGTAQLKENFENVEVAQWVPGLFREMRTWRLIAPTTRHTAQIIGLESYIPFSVRWKLKDGREFILENIDTAALMREYFKTHSIQLQWQAEGRPKYERGGDYTALLAHEIKDDQLVIKWVVTTNHTPTNERFLANGGATFWKTTQTAYQVAAIPGKPTTGIDFNKRMEFR